MNQAIERVKKNRTFLITLGTIFTTIGFLGTLSLAAHREISFYSIFITSIIALTGVLLIAWCFGEKNEYSY